MICKRKVIQFILAAFAVQLGATQTVAQEDSYEEEVRPGLHLHADASKRSLLSSAAKSGKSVVISSEYEDGASTVKNAEPLEKAYSVRDGDTLWTICERYFDDPYVWPRIWSYNTKVTNPHWIYPGDAIWLTPHATKSADSGETAGIPAEQTGKSAAGDHLPNTILVRDFGFIDKEGMKQVGEIVGSHKETKLLGQFDEAYAEFGEDTPITPGDKFAAFRILKTINEVEDPDTELGKLVEILGQVRATSFDKNNRIARVMIDETADALERGTMVGKISREFTLIPPVTNTDDVKGHLVAFLNPINLSATHHVVFIDRGEKHGVQNGNRFFAVENRDGLRRINKEPDDREGYPEEVLAEIRVIETRPQTSTCLITSSIRELEIGQKVEMRKGY